MLYVYALVALDARRTARLGTGVARERVRIEPLGAIGAIVGEVGAAPVPDQRAIRAHDRVVRRASRAWTAILPVRFGTTVHDARALRRMVQDRRAILTRALAHVRGRVQMTVRVFGSVPSVPRERSSAIESAKGRGTRYLRALADMEARARRLPEFDRVRAAVAPFVVDEQVEPHASPPLVASVFHLIDRGRTRAYLRAIRAAGSTTSLRLGVSGPFAPYAFAPQPI